MFESCLLSSGNSGAKLGSFRDCHTPDRKVMAAFASSHCGFDPLSSRFSANFGGCEPLDTHSIAVTEEGFRPAAGIGQDLAAPAAGIGQDLAAFSSVQCWNKADPVDVNTSPFHYCA